MKRKVCESLFAVTLAADCCCDEYSGHGICDRDKSVCETGTDD